ncbi:TPA: hypothetical protein KOD80_003805 [Clostridioides difficile]|nr:hypothetical protein [Clostridioides difficile]MDN9699665.1 hypothetical protein [Clostridioides difficile]HBF3985755.1 hypothetical protein [Clostridioides difficile]HBF4245636.1 hypothetical protein [Clostridioides difficile]HBF6012051.1 hypothetical protein [Clostridioides difficile]
MPRENRYRVNTLNELQDERRRNEEFRNRHLADWISGNISHNSNPTIVDQFNDELGGLANEFTQWNMGDFFCSIYSNKKS